MKSKVHGPRARLPKQKAIKKEMESPEEGSPEGLRIAQTGSPSVKIVSCISYQKFRYSGENRPGKKYQEKNFMELELKNLDEKVVRIVIICTDADNKELIHPNGLVGKDCHDGIYDKEYAITKPTFNIKIPYLRTERIKTKKDESKKIQDILRNRAVHLPSPYRERCESQCSSQCAFDRKVDTTKVCLGVMVTVKSHNLQGAVNGSLHAISHVVNNASEKTELKILKLSREQFSASQGGWVDIFTTEDGPAIENGKYFIHVSYKSDGLEWESDAITPRKEDILYKRIITYEVPPFEANPDTAHVIEATLHLDCPQSNQICSWPIVYSPHMEAVEEAVVLYETQNLKRSFTGELEGVRPAKQMKLNDSLANDSVRAGLKERLKRQEDSHNNSLSPALRIHETADNRSLLRSGKTHLVQNVFRNPSDQLEDQNDQDYQNVKVVAAAYSNSVPSDTVVIITNDGTATEDFDIENAISKSVQYFEEPSKGMNDRQQVIVVNSTQDVDIASVLRQKGVLLPTEPRPSETENHLKTKSSETVSNGQSHVHSGSSQMVSTPVVVKKTPKTESPWAVGDDDESDLAAFNVVNGLPLDKVLRAGKPSTSNPGKIPTALYPPHSGSQHLEEPAEKQKTITVLASKGDTGEKTTEIKSIQVLNNIDFSQMQLPSEILSSENIAKYDIVKAVNKDSHIIPNL